MKKSILFFFACCIAFAAFSQTQKPTFVSNSKLSIEKFLSGVKYAEIGLNLLNQEQVDKQTGIAGFYSLAKKYLYDIGFEYVALASEEKAELEISLQSYCDYTQVIFGGDINKKTIANVSITFVSCNGDIYSFSSNEQFNYRNLKDMEKKMMEQWKSILPSKIKYNKANRLELPSNPTNWTREKIIDYFNRNKNKLDPIEGIYERVRLSFEDISGGKYTVGIMKNPDAHGYLVLYLSGANNFFDWKPGEIKATFEKTATPGFFSVHWIARDKSLYDDVYCTQDNVGFNVFSTGVVDIAYKFIKLLPANEKFNGIKKM